MMNLVNFVTQFNAKPVRDWMQIRWADSIILSVIYCVGLVYFGQRKMRNVAPFNLKSILVVWNLALSVFSIAGSIGVLPELIGSVHRRGIGGSYCYIDNFYTGSSGFWFTVFTFSKSLELLDTLWLVLRRRPVIFLHWFHHFMTLIFTYYQYSFDTVASGRWGCAMNFIVHSFMYAYYAARSAGLKIPKQISILITTAQILQMIIGTLISVRIVFQFVFGMQLGLPEDCQFNSKVTIFQMSMFSMYLVLFVNFFYHNYIVTARKKRT